MEEPKKPNIWARIYRWFIRHYKIILISLGSFILVAGGVVAFLFFTNKPATVVETPAVDVVVTPPPEPVKYYSPLTGMLVADEVTTKQAVTGMMIENSPEARPQSGIKDSGVVFEAIAEAGITRFLVIYQEQKPQLIGPVRSVRMYYVDWIAAFNASIGHVGGSAAAIAEVQNGNYRNIDQFYNGSYFWRSNDRSAPHNVYTSFQKIDALNLSKGYTTSTYTGFARIDGLASLTPDATIINVTISSATFNSSYAYDSLTNTYARSQAGLPHLDRESGQISPSSVVAMHVDEYTMSDGHENIATVGSGNATIFQNGTATNAIWTKASKTSQIKFTDAVGVDIPLVQGQTWIVAVPNDDGAVTWS